MPSLYLAPWAWVTEGDMFFWRMPRADIGLGLLDLRSLPQCGSPGPTPQGYGLFAYSADPGNIGYSLGDLGSLVTAPRKRALKTALGLGEDIVADTPLAILVELLNRHADPTGQTRWKPLRGSFRSGAKLSLMGEEVWVQALDSVVRANIVAVFQADYRRNKVDGVPFEALRKWTGSTMLKLWGQMSDELAAQLLPPEYVTDGWSPSATVIIDNFNRADSTTLGTSSDGQFSWVEDEGDSQILSNTLRPVGAGSESRTVRANFNFGSDEHYSEVVMSGVGFDAAVVTRKAGSATLTFYLMAARDSGNNMQIYKRVTGTFTSLALVDSLTIVPEDIFRLKSDAVDLHDGLQNGVSRLSVTDTVITNNLQTGLFLWTAASILDLFEAGDLAAVGRIMGALAGHGGLAGYGGIAGRRGGIAG